MEEREISRAVIRRLPRYYRYLGELLKQDIKRISSNALSVKMNVTASQIRQDFNYFGGFGQQGYGYNVEHLYNEIGDILGLNDGDTTVIVGAGNLGRALASHDTFEKRGFKLVGIFDNDINIIGTKINGIEVMSIDKLEEFLNSHRVDIGFTYNLPANELEIAQMINYLKGLASDETLLERLPFITDAKEEVEIARREQAEKSAEDMRIAESSARKVNYNEE